MFDSIFSSTSTETTLTVINLLISLLSALILGVIISFVNMKTQKKKAPSQGFSLTLVMLPAVIAIIILLVGSNVARAFSLAGAFSIIRFRSAPGDPRDITFVLFSLAVGLASGMGYVAYAVIMTIILCLAMVLLDKFRFGEVAASSKMLKITIPEDLDYENTFTGVLERYTKAYDLTHIKTTNLGSLYQLCYIVTMKEDVKEKDFIDELRGRNGNLNITLLLNNQIGEY